MVKPNHPEDTGKVITVKLKKLKPLQVQKIDELLAAVGAYGEVRLVVQNGELRYIKNLISQAVGKTKPTEKS